MNDGLPQATIAPPPLRRDDKRLGDLIDHARDATRGQPDPLSNALVAERHIRDQGSDRHGVGVHLASRQRVDRAERPATGVTPLIVGDVNGHGLTDAVHGALDRERGLTNFRGHAEQTGGALQDHRRNGDEEARIVHGRRTVALPARVVQTRFFGQRSEFLGRRDLLGKAGPVVTLVVLGWFPG
jgi:hypothetical protein